jgi:hypothetical protein
MPYRLSWYSEDKRIILGEISGDLTLADIEHFSADMNDYLAEGSAPVHFLLDAANLVRFPTNIGVLRQAVTFLGKPALGWVVIMGGSSLMLTFAQLLMQLTPTRYRKANSLDDALQFLAGVDETLTEPG